MIAFAASLPDEPAIEVRRVHTHDGLVLVVGPIRAVPREERIGLHEALRTAIRHWEERSNEGRDYGEWIAVSDDPEAVLFRAVRDALRDPALAETPGEPAP
jgi:hypothetical protein